MQPDGWQVQDELRAAAGGERADGAGGALRRTFAEGSRAHGAGKAGELARLVLVVPAGGHTWVHGVNARLL